METQNITLSLPKELIYRARRVALKRRTSVSALLRRALEEIVAEEEGYEQARQRQLAVLRDAPDLGTNGKITWSREDLHER
jgi:hypothetical protein